MSDGPTPQYIPPGDKEAGPRRPNGETLSHEDKLANESLRRKQWSRWLGLIFILVFGSITAFLIVSTVSLADQLIDVFRIKELMPTPLFQSQSTLSKLPHMLPVLSISIFALLMFITLARFATDFVNDERPRDNQTNDDGSDEAAAIRVLKKLLALCGGK